MKNLFKKIASFFDSVLMIKNKIDVKTIFLYFLIGLPGAFISDYMFSEFIGTFLSAYLGSLLLIIIFILMKNLFKKIASFFDSSCLFKDKEEKHIDLILELAKELRENYQLTNIVKLDIDYEVDDVSKIDVYCGDKGHETYAKTILSNEFTEQLNQLCKKIDPLYYVPNNAFKQTILTIDDECVTLKLWEN